jgi:hypothetical protein
VPSALEPCRGGNPGCPGPCRRSSGRCGHDHSRKLRPAFRCTRSAREAKPLRRLGGAPTYPPPALASTSFCPGSTPWRRAAADRRLAVCSMPPRSGRRRRERISGFSYVYRSTQVDGDSGDTLGGGLARRFGLPKPGVRVATSSALIDQWVRAHALVGAQAPPQCRRPHHRGPARILRAFAGPSHIAAADRSDRPRTAARTRGLLTAPNLQRKQVGSARTEHTLWNPSPATSP